MMNPLNEDTARLSVGSTVYKVSDTGGWVECGKLTGVDSEGLECCVVVDDRYSYNIHRFQLFTNGSAALALAYYIRIKRILSGLPRLSSSLFDGR